MRNIRERDILFENGGLASFFNAKNILQQNETAGFPCQPIRTNQLEQSF